MTSNDLFQLNINYDQTIASLSNQTQKNGNITQLSWKVKDKFGAYLWLRI